MKKLLLITIILLFQSFPSFGEWKHMSTSTKGNKTYVDTDTIRNIDGSKLFWILVDFKKKDNFGDLSEKSYVKLDCKNFRYMYLDRTFFSLPMGKGKSTVDGPINKWKYPPPKSKGVTWLKTFC